MNYILTGFSQVDGYRVFAFQGVASDRSREPFWVRANLDLIRRYGIQMQDLPLLCRNLLDKREDGTTAGRIMTLTESDMSTLWKAATARKELAASKKIPAKRRVPNAEMGGAWRGAVSR